MSYLSNHPYGVACVVRISSSGDINNACPLLLRSQWQTKVGFLQRSPWGPNKLTRLTYRALSLFMEVVWIGVHWKKKHEWPQTSHSGQSSPSIDASSSHGQRSCLVHLPQPVYSTTSRRHIKCGPFWKLIARKSVSDTKVRVLLLGPMALLTPPPTRHCQQLTYHNGHLQVDIADLLEVTVVSLEEKVP